MCALVHSYQTRTHRRTHDDNQTHTHTLCQHRYHQKSPNHRLFCSGTLCNCNCFLYASCNTAISCCIACISFRKRLFISINPAFFASNWTTFSFRITVIP
eukprot:GDKI01047477.1.p3 GENE.GDKI01047477.1~~GDKI01047477.1.p3  ORF type:complete len:100 (+),score=1.56 GDKI01047477.1:207-506(+)